MRWDRWGQKPGQKDTSPCEALEGSSPAGACLQPGQCPWNALLPAKILSASSCLQPFPSWPKSDPAQRYAKCNKRRFCPQCGVCTGFIGPFHPWVWIFPRWDGDSSPSPACRKGLTPHKSPARSEGRIWRSRNKLSFCHCSQDESNDCTRGLCLERNPNPAPGKAFPPQHHTRAPPSPFPPGNTLQAPVPWCKCQWDNAASDIPASLSQSF